MANISVFFKEVREELKKVNWAKKDETVGTTGVVVVLVILLAIYIGIVDLGLSKIIQFVLG